MEKNKNLKLRPPVVVVLGHIDHGKTALLDQIRKTRVAERESGGITQHIGAYQIEHQNRKITFIDTPGHEAFSQMRSRGAKVADIAVLVVDSAEGVKPQTKEAILHIRQAGMPVIVALNKIDKPGADPEKVKGELAKGDILVESMGGKVPSVKVSAKTGQGIPELLEVILLVAEMEELSSDSQKPGQGVVIEAYLDSLRGPTATLLLTEGSLKPGDIVGTPSAFGKLKNLGKEALAADPIVVFGLNQVPRVGEEFQVFPDSNSAESHLKTKKIGTVPEVLEISEGQKVLNIVLKTDTLGSTEAIEEILKGLPQDKVILRILKSEAGTINESDLKLARSGKALILGFRSKVDQIAKKVSERDNIRIMNFEIIYDLVEGIRKFMEKTLAPEHFRTELGKVKVLAVFFKEKNRQIIGGRVTEGEVRKGAMIEVFREEEKIGQGRMVNLQRNKKDIDLVSKGDECGISYEGSTVIEQGDTLGFYIEEKKKGEL